MILLLVRPLLPELKMARIFLTVCYAILNPQSGPIPPIREKPGPLPISKSQNCEIVASAFIDASLITFTFEISFIPTYLSLAAPTQFLTNYSRRSVRCKILIGSDGEPSIALQ